MNTPHSPAADVASQSSPGPQALASPRGLRFAFVAAASVIVTSTLGRIITARPVKGWYTTLHKPSFNPPNWAFPVAWTLLFLLMAIAFWRVLRTPPQTSRRSLAIGLFIAQLCMNVGWSAAFFGANSALFGMIVIVPFWILIVTTAVVFGKIDRAAGWLFAPYIAWVAFASVLNAAILLLN
jgi:tryptophan-rich sensory protein